MRFFCSWLAETDLGPLHLLPASVSTPKIAYWRKKCQLLSSTGCFLNPLLEDTYFKWNLACQHAVGKVPFQQMGRGQAVPAIQSVSQPWVTRLYSHLRMSKPGAVLYINLCPYTRCCPDTSTHCLECFYLIPSPSCSVPPAPGSSLGWVSLACRALRWRCGQDHVSSAWLSVPFSPLWHLAATTWANTSRNTSTAVEQWETTMYLWVELQESSRG